MVKILEDLQNTFNIFKELCMMQWKEYNFYVG